MKLLFMEAPTMINKKKISFVIPVYQNEGSITETHSKIHKLFQEKLARFDYEIIFIDDGSTDNSLNEALKTKENDACVKILSFTRNFGQGSAIMAGLDEVSGDAIVNISADLQDPIELVPSMVEKWESGAEVVICHRINRHDDFASKLFSYIGYAVIRISVPQIPTGGFDYLLADRNVVDIFKSLKLQNFFFQADILWSGHRTCFIPYTRLARRHGRSQYNFTKKLNVFVNSIIATSYLPIRAMSFFGLLTSIGSIIYSILIFISWLIGGVPFKGWAPLMIVNLLIGGVIMTMLGIIGEYVWRINEEVRKRPHYIIRKKF